MLTATEFNLQVDFTLLSTLTLYTVSCLSLQVLEKENTYLSSECRNLKKIHQEYQAHLDKGKQDRKKLEQSNRDSLELMNRSVDKLQDYEAQISQLEQEVIPLVTGEFLCCMTYYVYYFRNSLEIVWNSTCIDGVRRKIGDFSMFSLSCMYLDKTKCIITVKRFLLH